MLRSRIKLSLLILLISLTFGAAGELESLFKQANAAYHSEKYQEAIQRYQKILSQGYESAELYYNIGNCYFRLSKIGPAILYYEKARRLDPHDPDIAYNLELANLKVVDRLEIPPRFFLFEWWDGVKLFYSIPQLSYLILILFSLVVLFLIIWLFSKRNRWRRISLSGAIVVGILLVFWVYIFLIRIHEKQHLIEGVVLAPTVAVRSAPDENSTDVFVLHEGSKTRLEEQRDKWVKISLPDGKTGWIRSETLGII